jgi:hypothetical protein
VSVAELVIVWLAIGATVIAIASRGLLLALAWLRGPRESV